MLRFFNTQQLRGETTFTHSSSASINSTSRWLKAVKMVTKERKHLSPILVKPVTFDSSWCHFFMIARSSVCIVPYNGWTRRIRLYLFFLEVHSVYYYAFNLWHLLEEIPSASKKLKYKKENCIIQLFLFSKPGQVNTQLTNVAFASDKPHWSVAGEMECRCHLCCQNPFRPLLQMDGTWRLLTGIMISPPWWFH